MASPWDTADFYAQRLRKWTNLDGSKVRVRSEAMKLLNFVAVIPGFYEEELAEWVSPGNLC